MQGLPFSAYSADAVKRDDSRETQILGGPSLVPKKNGISVFSPFFFAPRFFTVFIKNGTKMVPFFLPLAGRFFLALRLPRQVRRPLAPRPPRL